MKDSAEGRISVLRKDKDIFYTTFIPCVVCKSSKNCIQIEFLVDTGTHYTMISYQTGLDLGLEPPGKNDRKQNAKDANGNKILYIYRKIDLKMGSIEKKDLKVCWCISPKVKTDFLGMDFLKNYKLIINGKTQKFYITKHKVCVKCSK